MKTLKVSILKIIASICHYFTNRFHFDLSLLKANFVQNWVFWWYFRTFKANVDCPASCQWRPNARTGKWILLLGAFEPKIWINCTSSPEEHNFWRFLPNLRNSERLQRGHIYYCSPLYANLSSTSNQGCYLRRFAIAVRSLETNFIFLAQQFTHPLLPSQEEHFSQANSPFNL